MKQAITTEILTAIRMWKDKEKLSYDQIGEVAGVNASSVCQWFSGRTHTMYESTFRRLFPHIQKYLPVDFKPFDNRGGVAIINNGGTNYGNAVAGYALSVVLKKITDSDSLTAEEKIKFIKVLQDD